MPEDYLPWVVLEESTPDTIDKIAALRAEFSKVRSSGLAFILEEFRPGIVGVARPIQGTSGYPLGSINIALAMARVDEAARARCTTALTRAAATINGQLRWRLR